MNMVKKIAFPGISSKNLIFRNTIYNLTYEISLEIVRRHPAVI